MLIKNLFIFFTIKITISANCCLICLKANLIATKLSKTLLTVLFYADKQ